MRLFLKNVEGWVALCVIILDDVIIAGVNKYRIKKMSSTKFWLQDPCVLFMDFAFIPTKDMSRIEKLNALTRLVLIISVVMYFLKYKQWSTFLVCGILLVIVIYCMDDPKRKAEVNEDSVTTIPSADEDVVEGFSIVPTYLGTDFDQTIVSPTFAEEWQIPPPAYDLYTQVPYAGAEKDTFEMPLTPQSYPYGQYLTKTNLLPSDEYYTHMGCGGTNQAREYANSTFLRHDLAFRENMTRLYKKSLQRRFRHNTQDTFSPFHSY